MIDVDDLKSLSASTGILSATAANVMAGIPIPKPSRVQLFSPEEWEAFAEEYGHSLQATYPKVRRFGGSGDMGIDIACFLTEAGFEGGWDNYQCKRYAGALLPSDAWLELGKIIYYSWRKEFSVPRRHFFCASKGISTSLEKLLNNTALLKQKCREAWPTKCENEITSTKSIPLSGDLLTYFEAFDFTIFTSKSVADLILGHQKTPFHAVRFGGGLPQRPKSDVPPDSPEAHESRYVRQLLDAYGNKEGTSFADVAAITAHASFGQNFQRQRERFYHAEALRNFARDTVPDGTFAELQDEIYHGVADECDGDHPSGFERMSSVLKLAGTVHSTSNPLTPVTNVKDRQGICHQLANLNRLTWVP
jgi:hypothetical protein